MIHPMQEVSLFYTQKTLHLGHELGEVCANTLSGAVSEWHVRHGVPPCLCLGSEPLWVELLWIRINVLIKMEANQGDVYLRAHRDG